VQYTETIFISQRRVTFIASSEQKHYIVSFGKMCFWERKVGSALETKCARPPAFILINKRSDASAFETLLITIAFD
jgi:hypothetical protein